MELTTPGVATLRRDLDQTARDAETADVALAASGDGRAFERLYRNHVARVHSLARRMTDEEHQERGAASEPMQPAEAERAPGVAARVRVLVCGVVSMTVEMQVGLSPRAVGVHV